MKRATYDPERAEMSLGGERIEKPFNLHTHVNGPHDVVVIDDPIRIGDVELMIDEAIGFGTSRLRTGVASSLPGVLVTPDETLDPGAIAFMQERPPEGVNRVGRGKRREKGKAHAKQDSARMSVSKTVLEQATAAGRFTPISVTNRAMRRAAR